MTERNRGYEFSEYEQALPNKIKVAIRALGTMIIIPEYDKDGLDIGSKPIYKGGVQQPILQGDDRKVVVDKLVELIKQL